MKNDPAQARVSLARLPLRTPKFGLLALNAHTGRKLAETGRIAAIAEYMGLIHFDGDDRRGHPAIRSDASG